MNGEIVRFKNDAGQEVQITPQDVTGLICPLADQKEVALFLAHCAAHKLDPFTKEAYLIKYDPSKPASIVTNYNVFNQRAQRFPDYRGIEDGVVFLSADGKVRHRKGSAVYTRQPLNEVLLGGWAKVYREGMEPVYVELALSDYSTGRSKWKSSPGLMINKCAKAAAWRTAYPSEFNGMYAAEEMDQAQEGSVEVEAEVRPVPEPAQEQPRRSAHLQPIRDLFKEYAAACGGKDAALANLLGFTGAESMEGIAPDQVAEARDMMRKVIEMARAQAAPQPAPGPEPAPVYEEPVYEEPYQEPLMSEEAYA